MTPIDRYDSLIKYHAEPKGLDWRLCKAQIAQESSFDPDAVSRVGAMGLAQFMPRTWKEWAEKLHLKNPDPYNPEHSIKCQTAYMAWLLKQFGGDMRLALASYNFGIGRVKRGDPWPKETVDYVDKILANYEKMKADAFVL